jgi:CubicO group peptidase (beta-lactamase class C family)
VKSCAAAAVAVVCACAAPGGRSADPIAPADRFASVVSYLRSQVDSAFPGAVVAVGHRGEIVLLAAVGHYGHDDARPVTVETIYDLASLTKVVGLTTACMLLVEEGKLDLDAPAQRYVPAFAGAGKDRVTIRHLLTHASGLPAWRPLFREAATRDAALMLVDTTPLLRQPGDTFVYSDLGAIVLTQAVEAAAGERLDGWLARRVFAPLGMRSTRFVPPPDWRPRIAPTENDSSFRGRLLRGEVHDENAGRLDGVSGHAGLFSDAADLARFASWLLRRPGLARWTARQNVPPGSSRALGWDTPSGMSSAGTKLSPNAFGHTGFTGTSIWIDPDRDLFIILLSNRVNPTRANTKILAVRRRVADLVVEAL